MMAVGSACLRVSGQSNIRWTIEAELFLDTLTSNEGRGNCDLQTKLGAGFI